MDRPHPHSSIRRCCDRHILTRKDRFSSYNSRERERERERERAHLLVVVDDTGDLLAVSSESGHHLLCGVLKHHGSLVSSTSQSPRRVS